MTRIACRAAATAALIWSLTPAFAAAHTGVGGLSGFVSGVAHPIFGPDHLVAM
jgi:urease accessory protein